MSTAELRRDITRILLWGTVALVGVGFLGWHLLNYSTRNCEPTVRERLLSPDSLTEAVLWGYNCGWGTRAMSAVGVGDPGTPTDSLFHVLAVMDTNVIRLLTTQVRAPSVTLQWMEADSLLIRYPKRAKVMNYTFAAYGIAIAFDSPGT